MLRVDARWLYLARRKKRKEFRLIQGTRFLSILFNFVNIWGVVQHIYRTVSIRAMVQISHSVKAWHSIQLLFASLNRASIFHLMRNLTPSHKLPFALCILLPWYLLFVHGNHWRQVLWNEAFVSIKGQEDICIPVEVLGPPFHKTDHQWLLCYNSNYHGNNAS